MKNEPDPDQELLAESKGLEKVLEHRSRFTILVLLARHEEMNFRRLKDLLGETDGNLGAHLRRLEENSFVVVRKAFEKRKPVSWYMLSPTGREALQRHVAALHALTAALGRPGLPPS